MLFLLLSYFSVTSFLGHTLARRVKHWSVALAFFLGVSHLEFHPVDLHHVFAIFFDFFPPLNFLSLLRLNFDFQILRFLALALLVKLVVQFLNLLSYHVLTLARELRNTIETSVKTAMLRASRHCLVICLDHNAYIAAARQARCISGLKFLFLLKNWRFFPLRAWTCHRDIARFSLPCRNSSRFKRWSVLNERLLFRWLLLEKWLFVVRIETLNFRFLLDVWV